MNIKKLSTDLNLFQGIVENSSDGIIVLDNQGVILYCNPAALLLFRQTNETLEGQLFGFPVVTGESTDLEMIDSSGNIRTVEMRSAQTIWNEEKVYIASLRDISTRKEMETELRSSRKEWERTFNSIDDVITIIDLDKRIIRTNKVLPPATDNTPEDMQGQLCYNLFDTSGDDCPGCPLSETITLLKIQSAEIVHPVSGKTYRVTTFPLFDESKILLGAVHITKDVSKYKSLENRLRQAQKMESLGTLAGGIAHDFNNILSVILGYTTLLLDATKENNSVQEDLHEVYIATQRATDLVRQILTFSRCGEANRYPLKLYLVINEALKLLRPILPTSIEIKSKIDKGLNPVMADPTQIHQIIMNLCVNASHSMEPSGGILKVTLSSVEMTGDMAKSYHYLVHGQYNVLTVSDTGCGIDPRHLQSIFDPYFTTKDIGEGTGLGLSVVHGIVKECGGEIIIESELGKGSCFTLYFPTIQGSAVSPLPELKSILPMGSGRILVVDDEIPITKIVRRILEEHGFDVILFNNSTNAFNKIKSDPEALDLVITDMTMPGLTGDQLALNILSLKADLPVILMTGFSKQVSNKTKLLPGVKKILMKPVEKMQLLEAVFSILKI